jgi:Tfp pilus assembly protein PilV
MRAHKPNTHSFSLVEVVIALGIISFALVAIVGLFGFGLQTNKGSSEQIQAADVASLIVATARVTPTNLPPNFALPFTSPGLNQSMVSNTTSATPVYVGLDGMSTNQANATYNLRYVAGTNATAPNVAYLYLLLWWPPAAKAPSTNSGNYYQLSTEIALP